MSSWKSSQMRCSSSVIVAGEAPCKAVLAALSQAFSEVRVSDGQQLQLVVLCPETG